MKGFAWSLPGQIDAHLALVGPSVTDVADDPEGADVFAECTAIWEELPVHERRRITLVTLPMEDIGEAPKGVLLDTPERIARFAPAIRMQAVLTHAMPPNNFTQMTDEERAVLARWLKLETAQN